MLCSWKDFLGCPGFSAVQVNVNCQEDKNPQKNKINIFSWLMRQPGSLFPCSPLQYHDVTAKILHLQLSLTKHKVGVVKSPCTCAQFSQMWFELCQLLFAMTSVLDIYSIISLILKGGLYSSTGQLCHCLQQWKMLLEISQISFWG